MATREERIDRYYQGESAAQLAEWLVDAEDALKELNEAASDLADHTDATCSVVAERDRYHLAWTSARSRVKRARWVGISDLRFTRNMWSDAVFDLHRYRLAWLSARRRAADEANFGTEALALRDEEIRRLRAELDVLRKSTHGAPRLESMGSDEDGEVWRLEVPETRP
jgi:hypothetical protein